jgi:hypothetical protein
MVARNSSTVSSPPLMFFALISAVSFAFLMSLVWNHNHSTYQKRFAEWDCSFICERCGAIQSSEI